MKIAGVDIGTTGCKCSLYSKDGSLIKECYQEYVMKKCPEHEIDGRMVWECVKKIIKGIASEAADLKAIGVTSFGESVILLDAADKPLMNSMLYTDPRGEAQCDKLVAHFGARDFARITGLNPHKMYSIPKLMWISENRTEIYNTAKKIMQFGDFIVYMLSGIAQIDYSLASRTMAFDIVNLCWSKKILDYSKVPLQKLSKPVPAGTKAGNIKQNVARELGLPDNIAIVSGCHDQLAAAVGAGVLEPGMAVDGTGTVECVTPVFDHIPKNDMLFKGSYSIIPHVVPYSYVSYAFSFTGGALLKWYRDKLAVLEAQAAQVQGISAYEYFNQQLTEEPSGLLVLPHFSGAATPYMDSLSKGAIIGLTTETTSIDIYRALMEGVTYEMRLNMEWLKKAGIGITELRATGGGARSTFWLQLKADVLNIPVTALVAEEAGTVGSIMLAGVACGAYRNLQEASDAFVKLQKTYYPRPEKTGEYAELYHKYQKVYQAVKAILN